MTTQDQTRVVPLVAPPPEDPPAVPVKKANRRDYRVIEEVENGNSFRKIGVYNVSDGKAAIRQAAKEHGEAVYVAVAESAWTRCPVTRQTRESLVLG